MSNPVPDSVKASLGSHVNTIPPIASECPECRRGIAHLHTVLMDDLQHSKWIGCAECPGDMECAVLGCAADVP